MVPSRSPKFEVGLKMWFKKAPLKKNSTTQTTKNHKLSKSSKKGKFRSIFGPGDIKLLKSLLKTKNLTKSAAKLQYSYKYAWQKLQDLATKTGNEVVETYRGGYGGGGQMEVTPWGKYLISIYSTLNEKLLQFKKEVDQFLLNHPYSQESQ